MTLADIPPVDGHDPPDSRQFTDTDGNVVVQVHFPVAERNDIACTRCGRKIHQGKPYTYYVYIDKDKQVTGKEWLCWECEEKLWESS